MATRTFGGVTRVFQIRGKRTGWKWKSKSNNGKIVASCANEIFTRRRDARLAATKFGPAGFQIVAEKPLRIGTR